MSTATQEIREMSTYALEAYSNPASPAWDTEWDKVQEALTELSRRNPSA